MPNRNKWFVLVLAVASVRAGAHALAQQHALSGVEILRKVEQTVEVVRDYTVEVQADVNMERMRIPKMQATMYYKRPNKIHFESTSFAMLPREGMMLDPTVLRESYVATVQESEVAEEKKVYKLQLAAMESKSRLRQLYVWVDGSNWTIVKMETILTLPKRAILRRLGALTREAIREADSALAFSLDLPLSTPVAGV